MKQVIGFQTTRGIVKRVLRTATVLHDGWELDNTIWAVEFEDGSRGVVWTTHGHLYLSSAEEVADKIAETEKSLAQLRALIDEPAQQTS